MKNKIMSLAVFALIVPNVILGANKGWLSWKGSLLHLRQKSISERTLEGKNPISKEDYDPELVAWIEKLGNCESGNNPSAIGDNGLARGILQFHKKTFIEFAEKYNLYPYAEKFEIENFYLDSNEQKKLAILILTNEKDGWKHWYKCSLKIGLDKLIKTEYHQMDDEILSKM